MSDQSQGPGWWQGTDGKWYPPVAPASPPNKPASSKDKAGAGCLLVIIGLVIWIVVAGVTGSDDPPDSEELRFGAQDVCHQFVKERLRAPATAKFERYSEARITGVEPTYTVRGHVDSENGFGALIRSDYTCTVRHTTGDSFVLESLTGLDS